MAAVEGMAAGLPIIASPIGGIKDYLNDNTGITCPDNSPEEYKTALEQIRKSDRFEDYRRSCIEEAGKYDRSVTDAIMRGIYETIS